MRSIGESQACGGNTHKRREQFIENWGGLTRNRWGGLAERRGAPTAWSSENNKQAI